MAEYGSRPFEEAIAYFTQKRPLPTNGWRDVYGPQNDHALMVSGAKKTAIVEGFLNAIQAALADGETQADFNKRFDQIVQAQGWDYRGSRGWRTRLIYETNLRQAYNAGREAQMAEPGFRQRFPYAEYRHSGAENYRPQHKAWDRLVLPIDSPWWDEHSPSNGYFCKCKKFPVSERELRRLGKTRPDAVPEDQYGEFVDQRTGELKRIPMGIDPGFEHRPGASWLKRLTPGYRETWPDAVRPIPIGPGVKPPLPEPTPVDEALVMEDGLSDEQYVQAFLEEFGDPGMAVYRDVMGEPIAINDGLFRDANGAYKVNKDKLRHRYVRLLARTLIQPDEIWGILEPDQTTAGRYRLKRRYIKRWMVREQGKEVHGFSAFDFGQGLWTGSTAFTPHKKVRGERAPKNDVYLQKQREGVLLYARVDSD
ncbi:MAG: hypothetical protein COB05_04440 [Marinobacter sp.]|nr:MAG: hypothetical protein COB05_04440 [Marinobacter sp.]